MFVLKDTAPTEIYTYWHTLSIHDALPIAERHERDLQRVGAVRAADAVRHTDECSEMLLKLGDLGTQDELAVIEHASVAGIDLRPDARHLDRKSTRLNSSH